MAELLDLVDALSPALTWAWILGLAWGAGQLLWYRRGRPVAVTVLPAPRPRPRPRPRAAPAQDQAPAPAIDLAAVQVDLPAAGPTS
jgi:hypothetical protein